MVDTQFVSPTRKKTVHVVLFDVSASMESPLKLRVNAQDAKKGSSELDPKRMQTLFDVICRLAEDGIAAGTDQDMYAAVLCFGLLHVSTCDLLALLEERTKVLELLDLAEVQSTSQLPYHRAIKLLAAHGITSVEAETYLKKVPSSVGRPSLNGEQLYAVVELKPLVQLLASAGALYCEKYVESHLTPAAAGKYFMAFAVPDGVKNLKKLVDRLPDGCKDWFSISRFASERTPIVGKMVEDHAASEAIRFADSLLAGDDKQDVQALLRSIPTATPKPLSSVVQLVKRLQFTLKTNNEQDAAVDEVRLFPQNSPPTLIN